MILEEKKGAILLIAPEITKGGKDKILIHHLKKPVLFLIGF
jgi:hypothetical protein